MWRHALCFWAPIVAIISLCIAWIERDKRGSDPQVIANVKKWRRP